MMVHGQDRPPGLSPVASLRLSQFLFEGREGMWTKMAVVGSASFATQQVDMVHRMRGKRGQMQS